MKYLVFPHNPNYSLENDFFKLSKKNIANYYFGNHPQYDGNLIGIDILEFADSLPRLYYVDILSPIVDRNKIYDLISTHSFNPKKNSYIFSIDVGSLLSAPKLVSSGCVPPVKYRSRT